MSKQINVRDIDPKRSGNPAHSRALYLYVKRQTGGKIGTEEKPVPIPHWLKVWKVRPDKSSKFVQLWIGGVDQSSDGTYWLHGIPINRAIREYEDKTGVAMPRKTAPVEVKNFWAKYLTLGVCHVIDPYHRFYSGRWNYVSATERVCKVCGHREVAKTREVTKTIEEWVHE